MSKAISHFRNHLNLNFKFSRINAFGSPLGLMIKLSTGYFFIDARKEFHPMEQTYSQSESVGYFHNTSANITLVVSQEYWKKAKCLETVYGTPLSDNSRRTHPF